MHCVERARGDGRVGLGCGGQKKVPGLVDETWDELGWLNYSIVSWTGVEVEAASR